MLSSDGSGRGRKILKGVDQTILEGPDDVSRPLQKAVSLAIRCTPVQNNQTKPTREIVSTHEVLLDIWSVLAFVWLTFAFE